MTLEKITVQGTMASVFSKLDPSTIMHADELQAERINNSDLRSKWFWTADAPLYVMENDTATLYLGRGKDNPVFKNIDEATRQLVNQNNYFPNKTDIETLIKSDNTLRINLSDLDLKKYDDEWSYFEIKTEKYNKLNASQRTFAERVHGRGRDFGETMNMLSKANISTTRVYVLNPKYVEKNTPQDGAISCVSWLSLFGGNSDFDANLRLVDDGIGRLRGVSSVGVAEAQKIDEYTNAYTVLKNDPEKAGEKMTPEFATSMSRILTSYLSRQKQ